MPFLVCIQIMSTSIAELPYNASAMPNPQAPLPPTTKLPERDIPRETLTHAADPQTNPHYLPPRQPEYIPAQDQYQRSVDYASLLEEFRTPIILALLYFIFQLDSFQSFLQKTVPFIFKESNLTSNGAYVKSGLFGAAYYALTLAMQHLSRP